MLDAVLFDLDGTLTDPAEGITGAFRHAVASVGHPADDDVDLTWIIGPSVRDNLSRYGLPAEHHDLVVTTFRNHMTEVGLFQATVIAGVTDVLASLHEAGIPLALATAKPTNQAEISLDHFGLTDLFTVIAGNTLGAPISKGQIMAHALEQLGGPDPARVAMVGDRHHDIDGAHANGCIAVAVTWGYAEAGEMDVAAPHHVVDTPAELGALLLRLP
ncbi:MAG TPA: HAD hydrolase-like protein [Acidimicrobiales bacterium]|jgi:phosphoglycolate phosphatase|nr:HAD hydrolase-like protein [Acidimicrobiales bacterium]